MRMRATTWPLGGGNKIATYLESKTPTQLLGLSGYDDDKGRLVSNTAIVNRFQAENCEFLIHLR